MNKKIFVYSLLISFLAVSLTPCAADAGGWGKGKRHDKGLDEKICYKAGFMMMNEEELGLSDEQVDKIKDIKMATKREMVKRGSEIDMVKLDIKEKMYEDKIDPADLDPLIDKKYELKKAKAKYLVRQYADLKGVLSDDQMKELKSLWRKSCKNK